MLPRLFEARGGPLEQVLNRAGLDRSIFDGRSKIITRAQACTALNVSARLLGDPAFGLTAALAADPLQLGLMGKALVSGATLRECLASHVRAMPSFQGGVLIKLVVRGHEALWIHELVGGDPEIVGVKYEAVAVFLVATIRSLLRYAWAPTLVEFPHRTTRAKVRQFEEFFAAPVTFGVGESHVIRFPSLILDVPVDRLRGLAEGSALRDDPRYFRAAVREIDDFHMTDDLLVQSLERIVDAMMITGRMSLPRAAQALGLSARTLQRRLSKLHTAFEDVTERRRRARAMDLLSNPEARIADVALAVGYSDSAHFIRAFQKWHGRSPTEFRAALLRA